MNKPGGSFNLAGAMFPHPEYKFSGGCFFMTPGALKIENKAIIEAMRRHLRGDWGDVSEQGAKLNNHALEADERLLSEYSSSRGVKFWIITEADRSSTTVLLPEEY